MFIKIMSLSGIKRFFLRIEATITISLSEYNKLKEENLLLKKQVSELTGQVSGMMKIIEALVSYLLVYQYLPYHRIKVLLKDVFGLNISEGSIDNLLKRSVIAIEQRLTGLLQADHAALHKKVQAFSKRLLKNKDSILTFLYHPKVPPDNNAHK
jgi:hypothetical protein